MPISVTTAGPANRAGDAVLQSGATSPRLHAGDQNRQRLWFRAQRGFSLIEVSIVTAIMLLLAIIAIPAIGSYVIENKVPKVGEELARFILQSKINAPSGAEDPYADVNVASLANMARDSSVFTISGADGATKVYHGLGSGGEVKIGPGSSQSEFILSLEKVNHAACPSIASVMQRVVEKISVTQGGADKELKSEGVRYNALTAQASCTKGDLNTFKFTVG
jgi:prepilin-type N-terminal cleavage/methylation domain-containing protein